MIIIMIFGENNVSCMNFGWYGGEDVHRPAYIFCLLLKKTEKYKRMTYT